MPTTAAPPESKTAARPYVTPQPKRCNCCLFETPALTRDKNYWFCELCSNTPARLSFLNPEAFPPGWHDLLLTICHVGNAIMHKNRAIPHNGHPFEIDSLVDFRGR